MPPFLDRVLRDPAEHPAWILAVRAVVESGAKKLVVKSSYESELGLEDIYYTLYDDIKRVDMTVELRSKNETGDVLEMSMAPKKERMWLQFLPAFDGKAKCDTIANAIVTAAKEVGFKVPLVVRLEGTNVEKAREILEAAKPDIPNMQTGDDLTDAAQKIVAASAA